VEIPKFFHALFVRNRRDFSIRNTLKECCCTAAWVTKRAFCNSGADGTFCFFEGPSSRQSPSEKDDMESQASPIAAPTNAVDSPTQTRGQGEAGKQASKSSGRELFVFS
jgi:hypothetical protein